MRSATSNNDQSYKDFVDIDIMDFEPTCEAVESTWYYPVITITLSSIIISARCLLPSYDHHSILYY